MFAAVMDLVGPRFAHASFGVTVASFKRCWPASRSMITLAGVKGSGACGTGLVRFVITLAENEIDRPESDLKRCARDKSDPIDPDAASSLPGRAVPRTRREPGPATSIMQPSAGAR